MFNFSQSPNTEDIKLDKCIDDLLDELNAMTGSDDDYSDTADQLIKLMELKKKHNPSWRPSPDALLGAAASIAGIVLVLHYEKLDAVTSKALAFIGKMK